MADRPASSPQDEQTQTAKPKIRMRHFSRSLPMLLLRARESVMKHFRVNLRAHNLTEQQWRILRALMSIPDIEVSDLARATFLLGPSLSRILKDLEARALIERQVDAQDMRRARIAISPKGLALIEDISPQSELIYKEITSAFGEDRMRQLQTLLEDFELAMAHIDLPQPVDPDDQD